MNTVKMKLLLSLSYLSNGMIKYQCPYWSSLNGLTQSKERINQIIELYIQQKVSFCCGSIFSKISSMNPESFWFNQSKAASVGSVVLELAVNDNPLRRSVTEKNLYPVKIYYLYWDEPGDYIQIWIPILREYTRVERNADSAVFSESVKSAIHKLILGVTNGDWRTLLISAGQVSKVESEIWDLSIDFPLMSDNAVKINQDLEERVIEPESAGLRKCNNNKKDWVLGFDEQLARMNEALFMPRPTSVLIVGESGVGKTQLWDKFVQDVQENKSDYTCYQTDAISLIVNDGQDEWTPTKRLDLLVEFAGKNKGIYYMGNLWELDQAGRYHKQPLSLADFIVPHLERGTIGIVVECTQEQYGQIEKKHPGLIRLFEIIQLEPTGEKETRAILKKRALQKYKVKLSAAALDKIVSLYERYSFYEALPGAAVKFMDLLADRYSKEKTIEKNHVVEFFSLQTGLPQFLLDESIPFNRDETSQFFASRVIGQGSAEDKTENALNAVTGLIETIKAGLSRQNGPIASMLFIGPTGVGKTEMAKAIAEYLYNDPRRMIRIDMSEYSDILAAQRLINGTEQGEGILTSQVRMQPFGVVLLDEFEKASPAVFDLLLQVLGEGRLTDAKGRLANFSNCVIILTSNLGVSDFGKKSLAFSDSAEKSSQNHFTDAVAKLVRPELLNRIDKIVPFNALSKPILREILDKELKRIEKWLGIRYRKLRLTFDDSVLDKLVELGYNPQYGARPLKRTVEQCVLTPLADTMAQKNNPQQSYNVHFSLKNKKNNTKSDEQLEDLFSISLKAENNSRTKSISNQPNISRILREIKELILDVETVASCGYVQQMQSDVLYSLQYHSTQNNMVRIDKSFDSKRKLITRLMQIQNQVLELERKIAFDYLAHEIIPESLDLKIWRNEFADFLIELLSHKKKNPNGESYLFVWGYDSRSLGMFWTVINSMLKCFGGDFTIWNILQAENDRELHGLKDYMKDHSENKFFPFYLRESNGKVEIIGNDIRFCKKDIQNQIKLCYGVNEEYTKIPYEVLGLIVSTNSTQGKLFLKMLEGIHSVKKGGGKSEKSSLNVGMEIIESIYGNLAFPDKPAERLNDVLARSGGRRFTWTFNDPPPMSFGNEEVKISSSLDSSGEKNSFSFCSDNLYDYFRTKLMQYAINELLGADI